MMASRKNPWIEINNMRNEMDKIMNETMNLKMKSPCDGNRFSLWQPFTDLYETDSRLIIEIELPGVLRENIHMEVQGGQLIVYGEKKLEKDASGSAYQVLERSYGPFSRLFILPDNIQSSEISAALRNGVLFISIPKIKREKKRVAIEIS